MKCKETVERHFNSLGKDRPEELCTVSDIARSASRDLAEPVHEVKWAVQMLQRILPLLQGYAHAVNTGPLKR